MVSLSNHGPIAAEGLSRARLRQAQGGRFCTQPPAGGAGSLGSRRFQLGG
jgi:hypothetical protein